MNCDNNIGLRSKNDKKFLKPWYQYFFINLNKSKHKYWIASGVSLLCLGTTTISQAQVTSDNTTSTEVTTSDGVNFTITGGTQAQGNLFHSFGELSVPNGGAASFNNAVDIENIISRVTGSSISRIDGLIRANGNANLFLINPNGIIFGPNASLNIGGSFVATTANRLVFADGNFFSATEVRSQPILTVSVPVGLQFGDTVGVIRYQSPDSESLPEGSPPNNSLSVKPSKTLAFVGGNVFVGGVQLFAPAGRIELGSVAGNSFVKLTPISTGWMLGYDQVNSFRDIQLSQAFVSPEGEDILGDIQLTGRQIIATNESQVGGANFGISQGGDITIKASESVELSAGSSLNTVSLESGAAGNINISTKRLVVNQGASVDSSSNGSGRGGNINIYASESVESSGNQGRSKLYTEAFDSGDAGDLTIITDKLLIQDGAEVNVSSIGTGNAGNLKIDARTISLNNRGKLTAISESGKGGGNIALQNLDLLILQGESEISTTAKGEGNGGDITIAKTNLLIALDSKITANAEGAGNGGNVRIKTQGLFLSPNSKITATSERGIDGVVEIDRLENEPENALLTLPAEPVNIAGLIAQGCSSGAGSIARKGSEFVITGRGGLPPTPKEAFRGDVALVDLGKPIQAKATQAKVVAPTNNNQNHPESTELVEAQGWVRGSDGEVILTASAPNVTPSIPWMNSNSCHG